MKTNFSALLLLAATLTYGQPADKYAGFSLAKRSVELSTGITMKYTETGRKEGIPVLLLHGVTDSGRSFQLMIEELSKIDSTLRIIAPDLRGHGETSMPEESRCAASPENCFTPTDFASDILALMDQKKLPTAYIVGHSMGSVIAQEIALSHPGRVRGLVLIGPLVNGKESSTIHDFLIGQLIEGSWKPMLEKQSGFRWPEDAYFLTPDDLGVEVTDFLKENWVAEACAPRDLLDAIFPETIHIPLGTWIGAMRALGAVDYRHKLKRLKVPTLVLWATQDNAFPETPDQEWVKRALETASRVSGTPVIYKTYGKKPLPEANIPLSDLGHNLQWAAPQAVASDISAFIATGFPTATWYYAHPENVRQVLTEAGKGNILTWGIKEK